MRWIMTIVNKILCTFRGHEDIILEVYRTKDLIRCSRCNKIRGSYARI